MVNSKNPIAAEQNKSCKLMKKLDSSGDTERASVAPNNPPTATNLLNYASSGCEKFEGTIGFLPKMILETLLNVIAIVCA